MSYLLKSKQKKYSTTRIVLQSIVVLTCSLIILFALKSVIVSIYEKVIPIRTVVDTSVGYIEKIFVTKYAMEQKIRSLDYENKVLQAKLSELETYQKLSEEFGTSPPAQSVVARVISRPPFVAYDTLLLNKGSAEGIVLGARVFENVAHMPIGTITTIERHFSHVTLFSHPDNRVQIAVGSSSALFEAKGSGNGVLEAKLPKAQEIALGETIRIPKESAFSYGTVEHIQSTDSNPFLLLQFRLPVDFNRLNVVSIEQ